MEILHPIGNLILFENEQARVWQVDVRDARELPLHQCEVPYLVMRQTDGYLGVADSDGSREQARCGEDLRVALGALIGVDTVEYLGRLAAFGVREHLGGKSGASRLWRYAAGAYAAGICPQRGTSACARAATRGRWYR